MALVNKKITPEELAQRLVNSRKVMKKVDTDDYEKGNINEQMIVNDDMNMLDGIDSTISQNTPKVGTPSKAIPLSHDRINQSKLPDAIKQAMIEHPIPQISLNDSLDIDIADRAKKLMEKEGLNTKSSTSGGSSSKQKDGGYSTPLNESKLQNLIENAVRKVLDEKINQILAAQQLGTINENLVLKVGDSIFQGKITGVKNTKKVK